MAKTDNLTVKKLELRAPGSSTDDVKVLRQLMKDDILFSAVKDLERRQSILNNLLAIDGLIPSLYTFFEDLKFLKAPERIVRSLIKPPFEDSLREMIKPYFLDTNQSPGVIYFQDSETTFKSGAANWEDRFEFGYRQLWLYATRN